MTEEKIDIVVLWVDGSDPEFIREKQAVSGRVFVTMVFLIIGFE